MNSVLFSKDSDEWRTPDDIYNCFVGNGYVDPCPFGCKVDALKMAHSKGCRYFINPPYSKLAAFVDHFVDGGTYCVWLVPVRTDTRWFRKMFSKALWICFIGGRLHFNNSKNSAPFASMLVCTSSSNSFPAVFCCDKGGVINFMEGFFD